MGVLHPQSAPDAPVPPSSQSPPRRVTQADLIPQQDWDLMKAREQIKAFKAKEDEARAYLLGLVDGQIGMGDDPIGVLIASHAALSAELKQLRSDAVKVLEDSGDEHLCVFNQDFNHNCMICKNPVGEGARATGGGGSGEAARVIRGKVIPGIDGRDGSVHWWVIFSTDSVKIAHAEHAAWHATHGHNDCRVFLGTMDDVAQFIAAEGAVGDRAPGNDQKPVPGTG